MVSIAPPNIRVRVGSPTPALGSVTGVGEVFVFAPPTFPFAVPVGVLVPPVLQVKLPVFVVRRHRLSAPVL